MHQYLTRAVATAAFASLFNFSAQAGPAEEIEETFASLKSKAIPAFYEGAVSKNLDHLVTRPKPQKSLFDMARKLFGKVPEPRFNHYEFSDAYAQEFRELQNVCPALEDQNRKTFDTLQWYRKNIAGTQLSEYRRDFLEAVFFSIGRQEDTDGKIEALTELNSHIPDSHAFILFLDKKREILGEQLNTDPYLQKAKANWLELSKKDKQLVLQYISNVTLRVLLPDNTIEYPRLILVSDKMDPGYAGLYDDDFNETYLNYDREDISDDFEEAKGTSIHETFHAFQKMVANWAMNDELKSHIQLQRQAKLFVINGLAPGTGITSEENHKGYRTSFLERSAWAFQLAGSPYRAASIKEDMFRDLDVWPYKQISAPPLYKFDKEEGHLPAACLVPD